MRQPWIACPKDPRTEGVKIPPVRGPCADFQYFMCILLSPSETTKARRIMTAEGYHHRDSLSFPNDRLTAPSPEWGAAAGLLQSQFPLQPIANATLESKGSFETIGFKRLFLPTFPAGGKSGPPEARSAEVTRRSQQRQRASQAVKGYRHKYSLSLPRVLRTRGNPFHGRTSGFFNRPSSGGESRRKPIPCFDGAYDATLTTIKEALKP